jgi:hypothetical protein
MKRVVLVLTVLALALAFGATRSRADSPFGFPFDITLKCDNGHEYSVVLRPGDALQFTDSTTNFMGVSWFYTDTTGTHYLINSNAQPTGQPLVTCHYDGPVSGNHYTVIGFFTPVG